MLREDLKEKGYDKEEEYFKRMERELIEKRKRQRDQEEQSPSEKHRTG